MRWLIEFVFPQRLHRSWVQFLAKPRYHSQSRTACPSLLFMNNLPRLTIVVAVFSVASLSAQSPPSATPNLNNPDSFQVRSQSNLTPGNGPGVSPSPAQLKAASPAPTAAAAPVASSPTQPVTKTTPAPSAGSGKVVGNTETRAHHKEGSKSHGRTKKGKHRNEQDAIKGEGKIEN